MQRQVCMECWSSALRLRSRSKGIEWVVWMAVLGFETRMTRVQERCCRAEGGAVLYYVIESFMFPALSRPVCIAFAFRTMADQASPEQPGEVKPGETITPAEQGNNPDEDHKREEDSETFKALHTCAIYEGKPPYIDPKGARGKPYGPPPIQDWANKLIGKRLVAESAVGNSMVS